MEENITAVPETGGETAEPMPVPETEGAGQPESRETDPETPEEGLGERLERLEKMIAEREAELEELRRDSELREHFRELERGAEELKKELPDFELMAALEDPEFLRLTSPAVGLGVGAAYHALHYGELRKAAEERAAKELREALQREAGRPEENGAVRRGAESSQPVSYRRMSPEERAVQKRLILSGQRF